jgi:hypothetical protein
MGTQARFPDLPAAGAGVVQCREEAARGPRHELRKVPVGDNPPKSVNVLIEVPVGGEPVKYEFDKDSGAIFVDRILHTSMRYPANYGSSRIRWATTATRSTAWWWRDRHSCRAAS